MQDIHDIKPIIEIAFLSHGEKIFFLIFLLFLITVLISVVAYFILKRYFKNSNEQENLPIEKEIDYHMIFKKRLAVCESILHAGEYKSFHLCLSQAVKEYIGYKRHINALDMTTGELLTALKAFPGEQRLLHNFFLINDGVKYAGQGLEKETANQAYKLAGEIGAT